jgi:hypothetical protein
MSYHYPDTAVCECGTEVLLALHRGREIPVDVDCYPDGDLELCGLGMLRKPICIVYTDRAKWRFRPHWRCCPIQLALRPVAELTA